MKGTHVRFFAFPGEPNETSRKALNDALKRCLRLLSLLPPAQRKFTSHSMRIGSHTEHVLLGITLPVRLARFGWVLTVMRWQIFTLIPHYVLSSSDSSFTNMILLCM